MKLEFSRNIFENYSNIKLHQNPFSRRKKERERERETDRQTDRQRDRLTDRLTD